VSAVIKQADDSAFRSVLQHLDNPGESSTLALPNLVPSLLAAQSTSRFPEDPSAWTRWQAVDYEIMVVLQDHLNHIADGHGSQDGAWTEGVVACELLSGMTRLVIQTK
jgi:hypothetical protein